MLMPDNGDGPKYVLDRIGDYTGVLTEQLGIGRHPPIGVVVLVLAAAGMVVGCVRRPRLDVPLAALTVLSALAVSTHFRMVGRYYFQITPWVLYFAAAAIAAAAGAACSGDGSAGGRRPSPPCRCCSSSPCTSPCSRRHRRGPGLRPRRAAADRPDRSDDHADLRRRRGVHRTRPTSSPTSGPGR